MPNKVKHAKTYQAENFQFEVERDSPSDKSMESNLDGPRSVSSLETVESEIEIEENEGSTESVPNLNDYILSRDMIRSEIKPPTRYTHIDVIAYTLNIGDSIEHDEPVSYQDAYSSKDKANWLKAMKEEMESLEKNNT